MPADTSKDVAFYYPGPMWHHEGQIKNLLLFFDGIALLVPEYIRTKPEEVAPHIAIPLREQGLLHILEPEQLIDQAATEALTTCLVDLITSGAFDRVAQPGTAFHELSYSRLGWFGDRGLAEMVLAELRSRKLAVESRDGLSVPMHPVVRYTVLILLSQILRAAGPARGLELCPATDRPEIQRSLQELLAVESLPSAGQVVTMDLQVVGVDLSDAPLDEVLGFRNTHGVQFQSYARDVRRFVRELSAMPEQERVGAMADRQQEIADRANDLRKAAKAGWKQRGALSMSLAGAAWMVVSHDPIGALLAAAGTLLTGQASGADVGAYSYLFKAKRQYA